MTLTSNSIRSLLEIKDPNIKIDDIFDFFIHHTKVRIIKACLIIHQRRCPLCGFEDLVHNGHYTSTITYTSDNASHPIFIRLAKQRLKCKNCGHTIMAKTPLVNKYCNISNRTKAKIIMNLQDDRTQKCIAVDNNVSPSTVGRLINDHRELYPVFPDQLPKHLAFDEFRGVHHQLHFICIDGGNTHRIIKILPNRFKSSIIKYFECVDLSARENVETITMDLNSYYQDIVYQLFPNAKIVIDQFHIIAMMTRAFNQYRSQLMKHYKYQSYEYKLLKFSWRLYLKNDQHLSDAKEYYDRHIHQKVTAGERIGLGLALDSKLNNDYVVMHDVMNYLAQRNKDRLAEALFSYHYDQLSKPMATVIKTLHKHLEIVLNAAENEQSNGPLEGTNRMIKQIQRTAFGLSNFNHLLARINLRMMRTKKQYQV